MAESDHYIKYAQLLDDVIALAALTKQRNLDDESDVFFLENVNFFSKSYTVLMCAYLETYIKQAAKYYVDQISAMIDGYKLPGNLFKWSIQKEKFKHTQETACRPLGLTISDKDIDNNVSANPYTTVPFFVRLGIDLKQNQDFNEIEEQIETIVNKRNSIVHHSDDATDISMDDVIANVKKIKQYMSILDAEIIKVIS